MDSSKKGVVSFGADGQTYGLVFDFNAMCLIEDEFDMSVDEIGAKKTWRAKEVRSLFRIGLSRQHPDIDDEQAGEIISEIGAGRAGELIGEAFKAANSTTKEGKGKPRPRTGAASTT